MASYTRNTKVIHRELGNESALLNTETGYLHILNSTSSEIWTLLDHYHSVGELVAQMMLRYPGQVSADALSDDIGEMLAEFEKHSLVTSDNE